jgi:hypothetical protein
LILADDVTKTVVDKPDAEDDRVEPWVRGTSERERALRLVLDFNFNFDDLDTFEEGRGPTAAAHSVMSPLTSWSVLALELAYDR